MGKTFKKRTKWRKRPGRPRDDPRKDPLKGTQDITTDPRFKGGDGQRLIIRIQDGTWAQIRIRTA